ncbi:hypothetical protein CCR98_07655 [Stenotrophomonas sp. WZN-1]|uniref:hypothetical protein n=1 Tax=Stenotrophomonas sp. WZN-1 TaxID=2005046 RepID=UPI000B42E1D9|nr:hypothetical protein [Stenotrophomonas sp. WZN-1]ARZ74050.1 hypothetical protein CCR98_07655 [Stenotrophomonas sp. WZN-1]
MSAPVDVLAAMVTLCSFGGGFEARRVVAEFNIPRSTSVIRSHLRPATTAQVRAALKKAERAGEVERVAVAPSWRECGAAADAELHWRITPNALARVKGGAA